MPPMCADFVAYLLRKEKQNTAYHIDTKVVNAFLLYSASEITTGARKSR